MQNTTNTSAPVHPWTAAGLGRAPFTFVGYHEARGPIRQTLPDGIVVEVGAPGQPMGVCDACGTGIAHCYRVCSADGQTSVVGCDCIDRLDGSLRREALAARRSYGNAKRAESRIAADNAAARAWKAARDQQVADVLKANAGLAEALRTDHRIAREIAERFAATGRISPAQVALVLKLAADAATQWGTPVLGRATHRGVVVSRRFFEGFDFGGQWVVDLRIEGEQGPWILRCNEPRYTELAVGARVEITATVEQRSEQRHVGKGLRAKATILDA
jgi:hypothetical protein